jgi:hypothetical protein
VDAPPLASVKPFAATFLAKSFEKLNNANVIWIGEQCRQIEKQIRIFSPTFPFYPDVFSTLTLSGFRRFEE